MEYFLGALKPKADTRDYKVKAAAAAQLPESYICGNIPAVKNQKSVNSCVAHATSEILEQFNTVETNNYVELSTNFIYGMQGVAFGRREGGMYLRDACKIVKQYGDPLESTVSGNTEQPQCCDNLSKLLENSDIYTEAYNYKIESYARCTTDDDIKHALINYGPVLASIKWYKKYTFDGDILHFDKNSDYGYHAIMIIGYDKNGWICQNSWGRTWGNKGRFVYPYEDKLTEAWSFVDAKNTDVIVPVNNSWMNYIYKFINYIINLFKR